MTNMNEINVPLEGIEFHSDETLVIKIHDWTKVNETGNVVVKKNFTAADRITFTRSHTTSFSQNMDLLYTCVQSQAHTMAKYISYYNTGTIIFTIFSGINTRATGKW